MKIILMLLLMASPARAYDDSVEDLDRWKEQKEQREFREEQEFRWLQEDRQKRRDHYEWQREGEQQQNR